MTYSYIVCEKNNTQRSDNGQCIDDRTKMGYGAGSCRIIPIGELDQLEEELDPCLSAAVRQKKEPSEGLPARLKYCLCCVVVFLLLALLAVSLLLLFGSDCPTNSHQRTTQFEQPKDALLYQEETHIRKENNQPKNDSKYHHEQFTKEASRAKTVQPQFKKDEVFNNATEQQQNEEDEQYSNTTVQQRNLNLEYNNSLGDGQIDNFSIIHSYDMYEFDLVVVDAD